MVGVFDQVPFDVVSVWPCCAVPVIAGAPVLTGASGSTTAVGVEVPVPVPSTLVAVSNTTIVWPTSLGCSVYVVPVAPEIAVQEAPAESQSCHWSVTDVGVLVHVPWVSVSVSPCLAVPLTVGCPPEGAAAWAAAGAKQAPIQPASRQ